MIKHCLVRGIVTDPKRKPDDVIVSLTHNRPAMWWRRWVGKMDPAKAKPGRVVARGESFGLPDIQGTQWVTFDKSEPTPDIQWMALRDNTPSVVEVEDPMTGESRFFADEASAMAFMMSL
jgi:hypothetical protein